MIYLFVRISWPTDDGVGVHARIVVTATMQVWLEKCVLLPEYMQLFLDNAIDGRALVSMTAPGFEAVGVLDEGHVVDLIRERDRNVNDNWNTWYNTRRGKGA